MLEFPSCRSLVKPDLFVARDDYVALLLSQVQVHSLVLPNI